MDRQTLAALRGSIKKWKNIASGKQSDHGTKDCPLCQIFYRNFCKGCPVYLKTERSNCQGTPYYQWRDAAYNEFPVFEFWARSKTAKRRATAMLRFLEKLLPPKRTAKKRLA